MSKGERAANGGPGGQGANDQNATRQRAELARPAPVGDVPSADRGTVDGAAVDGEAAAFWRFAVAVYARPGVEAACLSLQDTHGFDVPMTLFCAYAGLRRGRLPEAALTAAIAASTVWRVDVVAPLRAIRRRMKTALEAADGASSATAAPRLPPTAPGVRAQVKAAELAAEEAQIRLLAQWAASAQGPAGPAAADANFARYAAVAGAPHPGARAAPWALLCAAAVDVLADAP